MCCIRVPLAVILCVSILRSCGVLLCVVNTLSGQRVAFFKCMSPVMYYVIIIHSVFNDLELVFDLHQKRKQPRAACKLSVLH